VVHGGGPQIGKMLEKLGIKSEFQAGLARHRRGHRRGRRDGPGRLDQQADRRLDRGRGRQGGRALRQGRQHGAGRKATRTVVDPDSNIEKHVDLGFVGEPEQVNRAVLDAVLKAELIPVLGSGRGRSDGQTYNVNADTFAGAIAGR
jgi:acetylglutamate kinase